MTNVNVFCEETAKRLKRLRTSKGLSHEKLSEELSKRYGITISKSSLINYEATDYSSKSGSNAGMKIEYLWCLSDFYGVSADYLLGKSSERSPDVSIQAVCRYTGLSETAVEKLKLLYDQRDTRAYSDLLSLILSDADLEYLLGLLEGYLVEDKGISAELAMSRAYINPKDLAIFTASDTIRQMLERIAPEFLKRYLTTEQRLDIVMEKRTGGKRNGKH
ncbi:MAG: hypothetical protein IKE62_01160 [Oscillospiraceae bacterium]|nr:hypothetical protein [Oscillospiraceae bacterium]